MLLLIMIQLSVNAVVTLMTFNFSVLLCYIYAHGICFGFSTIHHSDRMLIRVISQLWTITNLLICHNHTNLVDVVGFYLLILKFG